jgi:hypothetical protein
MIVLSDFVSEFTLFFLPSRTMHLVFWYSKKLHNSHAQAFLSFFFITAAFVDTAAVAAAVGFLFNFHYSLSRQTPQYVIFSSLAGR